MLVFSISIEAEFSGFTKPRCTIISETSFVNLSLFTVESFFLQSLQEATLKIKVRIKSNLYVLIFK